MTKKKKGLYANIHAKQERIKHGTFLLASKSGIDAAPEGGAALEATRQLVSAGRLERDSEVVVFNTGSGASYRW